MVCCVPVSFKNNFIKESNKLELFFLETTQNYCFVRVVLWVSGNSWSVMPFAVCFLCGHTVLKHVRWIAVLSHSKHASLFLLSNLCRVS